MQPAGPGESRIERGLQYRHVVGERTLGCLDGQALQQLLRRDTGPASEHACEVVRRDTCGRSDFSKARLLTKALLDEPDGTLDAVEVLGCGGG